MKPEITLVTLGVGDVDESIRFYRDGLGFPMQDREEGDDVAFFTLDGTWLSLYPRDLLAEDATVPAAGRVVKPAGDAFWSGYSGYFADSTAISGR